MRGHASGSMLADRTTVAQATAVLDDLPGYVARDRDRQVRSTLTRMCVDGGFLLLTGPPAAGRSRCAMEALRQRCPDWWWWAPADTAALCAAVHTEADLARTVIWLPDLHDLLEVGTRPPDPPEPGSSMRLTDDLVRQLLAPGGGPVVIVATMWDERWRRYHDLPVDRVHLFADAGLVSSMATRIELAREFTRGERRGAHAVGRRDRRIAAAADLAGPGESVASVLAGAATLVAQCRAADEHVRALVSAAVIARRCGHPRAVPSAVLEAVAEAEGRPWFAAALQRALERAALTPAAEPGHYLVSASLVDRWPEVPAVPQAAWGRLIESAGSEALTGIAAAAHRVDLGDVAAYAATRAARSGRRQELSTAGLVFAERGEYGRAERLMRSAIAAGSTQALNNLGYLLCWLGRLEEGEATYRLAVDAGNATAMVNLADLLCERGDDAEGEALYARAGEAGRPVAWHRLGDRHRDDGDLVSAERYYQLAADADDRGGLNDLANLFVARGEFDKAERLFRRALAVGNTHALVGIGSLHVRRGQPEKAVECYLPAAEDGVPIAVFNLGVLYGRLGESTRAEALYEGVAATADDAALAELAQLFEGWGDHARAAWFRQRMIDQ